MRGADVPDIPIDRIPNSPRPRPVADRSGKRNPDPAPKKEKPARRKRKGKIDDFA